MNNIISIQIDSNIYNEDVLHKCLYWYTGQYDVTITRGLNAFFNVRLIIPYELANDETKKEIEQRLHRDLIDFKLRDIVTKETRTVRELIIAKAFAYYEEDGIPVGKISDPVGFNPTDI